MIELKPFGYYKECPKCGFDLSNACPVYKGEVWKKRRTTYDGAFLSVEEEFVEFLTIECRCGFKGCTKTKDAECSLPKPTARLHKLDAEGFCIFCGNTSDGNPCPYPKE